MVRYRCEALLPVEAADYILERDGSAFRSLVAKSFNLQNLDFVQVWSSDGVDYARLLTRPRVSSWVPRPAFRLLPGRELVFIDTIRYDPGKLRHPPYVLQVRTELPVLGQKADISSVLTIDHVAPNLTRQTLEGHIDIRLAGVGSLAERIVRRSLQRTYERLPAVVGRWAQYRDKVLRQPGGQALLMAGRPSFIFSPCSALQIPTPTQGMPALGKGPSWGVGEVLRKVQSAMASMSDAAARSAAQHAKRPTHGG